MNDDFSASRDTTGVLAVGASAVGIIEQYGDADWFKVHLEAGRNYQFGATSRGVTVTLMQPNGETLLWPNASSDDPAALPTASYRADVSGDYFVCASALSTLGGYTLFAREVALNDHPYEAAASAVLGAGSSISGMLGSNNDIDAFTLSLSAGHLYQVTLTETLSAAATVKHETSFYVTGADADPHMLPRSGAATSFTLAPEHDVQPLLLVGNSSDPGAYTVHVEQLADDYAPNAGTSGRLAMGTTVHGSIEAAYDQDWFAVDLDPAHSYLFALTGSGDAHLTLYNADQSRTLWPSPDENTISPWPDDKLNLSFSPTTAARYYLQASGGSVGNYTISATLATDDVSNVPAQFPRLAGIGAQFDGKLDYAGDIDSFTFAVQQGTQYTFDLSATSGDSAPFSRLQVYLHDASGNTIFPTDSLDGKFVFKADSSGIYTMAVQSFSKTELNSYKLTAVSAQVDDYADSAALATPLVPGQHLSGNIELMADTDAFKLTLAAGQTIELTMDGAPQLLHVIGPEYNSYLSTLDCVSGFTASVSGDYQVNVSGHTVGAYGIVAMAYNDDVSGDATTTSHLAVNGSLIGMLSGYGESDWHAITLTAGIRYHFNVNSPQSGFSTLFSLLDSAGSNLYVYSTTNGLGSYDMDYLPSSNGTYYLALASSVAGSYTLSAQAGPADDYSNYFPHPTSIAVGQIATGSFYGPDDIDVVQAHLLANHFYEFKASSTDANGTVVPLSEGDLYWPFPYPGIHWSAGTPFHINADSDMKASFVSAMFGGANNFSVQFLDLGADDFPDRPVNQPTIGLGATAGTLGDAKDEDHMLVHLLKDQRYVFTLDNLSGAAQPDNISVSIGDSAVAVLLSDHLGATFTFAAFADGDYKLTVRGGSPAPYVLHITNDSSDHTAPTATTLTPASLASAFPATTGMTVAFSETVVADTGTLRLLDAGGNLLTSYGLGDARLHFHGASLTLDTDLPFYPGQSYTLELGAASLSDESGNALAATRMNFSAAAAAPIGEHNDLIPASAAGAAIDGKGGVDTAFYAGAAADYTVRITGGVAAVAHAGSATPDLLTNVERLLFTSGDALALDIAGTGGKAYRLYQAALDRTPDQGGLGFWIANMDKGLSLNSAAQFFLSSPEFVATYGSELTDGQFIDQLYANVLHRAGEAGGVAFWNNAMAHGSTRAEVLAFFSESPENTAALATLIGNGFHYQPYT